MPQRAREKHLSGSQDKTNDILPTLLHLQALRARKGYLEVQQKNVYEK